MGVTPGDALERQLLELKQLASGVELVGEVSDRVRARVLASGELLATALGAQFLQGQGLDVTWVDARSALKAERRSAAASRTDVLSATCDFRPDAALQRRWSSLGKVILTQGFIASDAQGETVLLGRGGSDTSSAYLAAKLQARRLEVWTDVPGMFSANPRVVPGARLLKALHYDEAQEIASNGAKVLHPRCILPVRQYAIPLHVYDTHTPELEGTHISAAPGEGAAQVKAIAIKKGITLISMESPGMWHQVGFLADAFQVFKRHGMSVDLVSTSETNVTVSLDAAANTLDRPGVAALLEDLSTLCRAQAIGPCASLSLVGRNIRGILHRLGSALALFEEQKIHLVSQAANDLNFTFVIDEDQGERLVQQLHDLLIRATANDKVLGPTWEQLHAQARFRRCTPGTVVGKETCRADSPGRGARCCLRLRRSDHRRAHCEPAGPLRRRSAALCGQGESECGGTEMHRRRRVWASTASPRANWSMCSRCFPASTCARSCSRPTSLRAAEYVFALDEGVPVTLDNLYPLREWPELFRQREILLRIDTGHGRGHHQHVRTAGEQSKFGIPLFELDELRRLAAEQDVRVIGLHAHTGSGIFSVRNWTETAELLAGLLQRFPDVRCLDVGGGLGVPERPGELPLDLGELDQALQVVRKAHPGVEIWLEPGRFIVAEAGVLLAQVTQLKGKGEFRYVGVATGMNSLIRPALYGSHHEIVNLTRLDEPATETFNIVGPICESGDQLGVDRLLPPTREGDILLIANAGAYGRAMSSNYNLRAPAREYVL